MQQLCSTLDKLPHQQLSSGYEEIIWLRLYTLFKSKKTEHSFKSATDITEFLET